MSNNDELVVSNAKADEKLQRQLYSDKVNDHKKGLGMLF
jgi:hypothetical protein